MSKDIILSLIRSLLIAFSSYFVGKHVFGQAIDDTQWQGWVALIISVATLIWGFVDKTNTLDSVQSAIRGVVIFIGGIFVAKGSLTSDQLTAISGLVLAVAPFLYSVLSKKKVVAIAKGNLVANANGSVTKKAA